MSITCNPDENYAKFEKINLGYCNEETFRVYSGEDLIYTSIVCTVQGTLIDEVCLPSSTNSQYTIELVDSYGDSWDSGSYLTIYGQYGNAVFKNMMVAVSSETFSFSLYYGIRQSDTWKMTSGVLTSIDWTTYSFPDTAWTEVTLGSDSIPAASDFQYFRKQFVGLANMAAYDVRLYYKAGVIAYINGVEVYRDNMSEGDVTSDSTPYPTGQYSEIGYHGFIRPGAEVAGQQSILAVEIHFIDPQSSVDFNAYLAILAATAPDSNCFSYAEPVDLTTEIQYEYSTTNIFDFTKNNYIYCRWSYQPCTVDYPFGGPKPYINGVRIYTDDASSYQVTKFSLEGSYDNTHWTTVMSYSDLQHQSKAYQVYNGYIAASLYNYYHIILGEDSPYNDNIRVYELQPLICHTVTPSSILFTPNTYTVWTKYENVYVKPDLAEFTSCTADNLPAGLTIDSATCVISGIMTTVVSDLVITVHSEVYGVSYSGTFTITSQECSGTMLNILRVYSAVSHNEGFEIQDAITHDTVFAVLPETNQVDNTEVTMLVCLTGTKYSITLLDNSPYWTIQSFITLRTYLSDNEMETILRMRHDLHIGFASTRTFNAQYSIPTQSDWYYKFGSVDADWYSSTSTTGWAEGNDSNFPESSNQIQLYKKTFTVSDINNIAGFVLSIKYKYGCIVYLNGHEAFRKGLTDATISTSSYANNMYTDAIYRQISLPIKTMQIDDTATVNYIQQGSNTIAIGIVAESADQKDVIFDCALRLMGEEMESRVFSYSTTPSGISGGNAVLSHTYYYTMTGKDSCENNYLSIKFNNDRHEWINALTINLHYQQQESYPLQLILKARNNGDSEYESLAVIHDLIWSYAGESKTIYFPNNKPYNEYVLSDIYSTTDKGCKWEIGAIDLRSFYTTMTVPDLVFNDITAVKDVRIELLPNSEYYNNFHISPMLPRGLTLDLHTGMISGTPTEITETREYSLTATRVTGGSVTITFSITVSDCDNGRSYINLVIRSDEYPEEISYKLYRGMGDSASLVVHKQNFIGKEEFMYELYCLNAEIYTLEFMDSRNDGWLSPAGYYLTIDRDPWIFEMGHMPKRDTPLTTLFSAYLPFQAEYSEWKVSNEYGDNWYYLGFDDSAWELKKASEIGANEKITTFLRREVNIPDMAMYHVLNVRVKYVGGVAAYFNGFLTARFNLDADFNSETEASEVHDSNTYSKFHIILPLAGGFTGNNLIAFEIHRPRDEPASNAVVFDATGVFGVNECSILVDSYSAIDGSPVSECTLQELLDLNPTTVGYQPNSADTYLQWEVENLVGAKFNNFAMLTAYHSNDYGFSLYARADTNEEFTSILSLSNVAMTALQTNYWETPQGMEGYKQLKFLVTSPAQNIRDVYDRSQSELRVSTYMIMYCHSEEESKMCDGIGDYPSVGEGAISTAGCGYGFSGYSYRICSQGQLGEIKREFCIQHKPENLTYIAIDSFILIKGRTSYIPKPTYDNIVEKFYLAEGTSLPAGLMLDSETGEITGIPTAAASKRTYTVIAWNQAGEISTIISIEIIRKDRIFSCREEGYKMYLEHYSAKENKEDPDYNA